MIVFPVMAVIVTVPVMFMSRVTMAAMRIYKTDLMIMMMMGHNSMCQQYYVGKH